MNTTANDTLAAPALLLLAARQIHKTGAAMFSPARLIVAAWSNHPEVFGLQGFAATYPDSHKVLCSLCGGRGLVGRGLMERDGKMLRLTQMGIRASERLALCES